MRAIQAGATALLALGALSVWGRSASAAIDVSGSAADQASWNSMIAECNKTPQFKTIYDEIKNSAKHVQVKLMRDKKGGFWVDSAATNEVNLDDLEALPKKDPARTVWQCEEIVHFLWERFTYECNKQFFQQHGWNWLTEIFPYCHRAAINKVCDFRKAMGYKDWPTDFAATKDPAQSKTSRICITWEDDDPDHPAGPTVTYIALATDRQVYGAGIIQSAVPMPGGVTRYTVSIDPAVSHDELVAPPQYGDGVVVTDGFTGTLVVDMQNSTAPDHCDILVVSYVGTAPSITLPDGTVTGVNNFEFDPDGWQFGILNRSSGQGCISYSGKLTNNLYPPNNPVRYFSTIVFEFHPGDETVEYNCDGTFLNLDCARDLANGVEAEALGEPDTGPFIPESAPAKGKGHPKRK